MANGSTYLRRFWSMVPSAVGMAVAASLAVATLHYVSTLPNTRGLVLWWYLFVWQLMVWAPWVVFGPLVVFNAERLSMNFPSRLRRIVAHAVVGIALYVVTAFVFVTVLLNYGPLADASATPYTIISFFVWWMSPSVLALYFGLVLWSTRGLVLELSAADDGFLDDSSISSGRGVDHRGSGQQAMSAFVFDPSDHGILAFSRSAVGLIGSDIDEIRRKSLLELMDEGTKADFLGRERRSTGHFLWGGTGHMVSREVEYLCQRVRLNGVSAVLMLLSDVTAVVAARRALESSERKYRSIIENAVMGVYQSTLEGQLITINRAGAEILGYDSPEVAVALLRDLGSAVYVDPEAWDRFIERLRRDGQVSGWVSQLRSRDGRVVSVSANARLVCDESGAAGRIDGMFRDITDELEARAALRESEHRAAELKVQLATAQLRALQLQLKPHFLFNTLNTVAMMIRNGDHAAAQEMVTMLGDLFRFLLEFEGQPMVPLEQELDFVDLYLNLQQHRFHDRMDIGRDIDPAALAVPVPTLILQPLVENAIHHGVSAISGACHIGISARVHGDHLAVELVNDASVKETNGSGSGHSVGIANTRARLAEHYDDAAAFELVVADGRATAKLRMPIR